MRQGARAPASGTALRIGPFGGRGRANREKHAIARNQDFAFSPFRITDGPMDGGDLDAILQRIDSAIGRIDAAMGRVAAAPAADDAALRAENARLRSAVGEAIAGIDGLLAAAHDGAAAG